NRLECPGKPLLGIGDQDQRGTGRASSVRHYEEPSRWDDRRPLPPEASRGPARVAMCVQTACTEETHANSFELNGFFSGARARRRASRGRLLTRCNAPAASVPERAHW